MKFRNLAQAGVILASRGARLRAKTRSNGRSHDYSSKQAERRPSRTAAQAVLGGEDGSLTDEALLELLLSYAIVRRDVQPLAKSLLAKFGSLDAVLAAEPAALRKISGVKDTTVALLKLAQHFRNSPREDTSKQLPYQKVTPPSPPATKADEIATEKHERAGAISENAGQRRTVGERKLQVSNGYLLETAQLARLLGFIESQPEARKISSAELIEGSGLSARQVESLVSIGSALGLITPRTQLLTPFGELVVRHDVFLDAVTTLEFCHFLAAGMPAISSGLKCSTTCSPPSAR